MKARFENAIRSMTEADDVEENSIKMIDTLDDCVGKFFSVMFMTIVAMISTRMKTDFQKIFIILYGTIVTLAFAPIVKMYTRLFARFIDTVVGISVKKELKKELTKINEEPVPKAPKIQTEQNFADHD